MMREGPVMRCLLQKHSQPGPFCRYPVPWVSLKVAAGFLYNEQARRVKEDNAANWITRDPEVKCYMPGVPRATYLPHPFQIIQSDNDFFIAYQFAGAVRDIYLEDPGPAPLDSWMGWSAGRWDGDTWSSR